MAGVVENGAVGAGAVLTKDDVMTTTQAAAALGVAEYSVRRYIRNGVIPSLKAGNSRFIRRDVIDAMVNRTALCPPRPHEWETVEEFIALNRPDLARG